MRPLLAGLLGLCVLAAAMYGVAAWLAESAFGLVPRRSVAVASMAVVVWGASLLGAVPVVLARGRGPAPTVAAYFLGAAARVVLCLGAALVGSMRLGLPAGPLLLTLVVVYLPLLWLESGLVAWGLWRSGARTPAAGDGGAGGAA